MYTSPNSNSYPKGQKINVSMMLKVPIDIELEIVGVPSTLFLGKLANYSWEEQ